VKKCISEKFYNYRRQAVIFSGKILRKALEWYTSYSIDKERMEKVKITDNILYVGVNDHQIELFEGQYKVPNGMAYNSYVIMDEHIAVMDTVDIEFTGQWLENVEKVLDGRKPHYLVVQHMEPDHAASIPAFLDKYPETKVVATPKAFDIMGQFYEQLPEERRVAAANGGKLELGSHVLNFVFAPMVHWPEVMLTYESTEKVLFSADAFGKFGALDVDEEWADEARRYYIGIVGKYGMQVQNVLKKAQTLDIQKICPLHGPVLSENLGFYLNLYDIWSSYRPEEEGITIAYTSVYGNTRKAVCMLEKLLRERTKMPVVVYDLARDDMAAAVADAFRYSKLVLATTTYNAGIFPFMKQFIDKLTERGFQNRTVAIMENGSWAPIAAKTIKGLLEKSRNITFTDTTVTLLSALNEASTEQVRRIADELL